MSFAVEDGELKLRRVGWACDERRGEAHDQDEVCAVGRREKLPVSPVLEGEIEGVVGLGDLSGFGKGVHGDGVSAAIGEEDLLRGEKWRGDGRDLLGAGDGKNQGEGGKEQGGADESGHGVVLDFPRCEHRTGETATGAEKTLSISVLRRQGIPVYMLMPKTAPRVNGELAPHLWMLAAMAVATAVLAVWPQWVVHTGYRCELQVLIGLRCPFCGMTRDFAAILHGGKATLNPCSWLAALVVFVVYPVVVLVGWHTGRLNFFHGATVKYGMMAALAVMLVLNNLR